MHIWIWRSYIWGLYGACLKSSYCHIPRSKIHLMWVIQNFPSDSGIHLHIFIIPNNGMPPLVQINLLPSVLFFSFLSCLVLSCHPPPLDIQTIRPIYVRMNFFKSQEKNYRKSFLGQTNALSSSFYYKNFQLHKHIKWYTALFCRTISCMATVYYAQVGGKFVSVD
jgi:hypothetical protein